MNGYAAIVNDQALQRYFGPTIDTPTSSGDTPRGKVVKVHGDDVALFEESFDDSLTGELRIAFEALAKLVEAVDRTGHSTVSTAPKHVYRVDVSNEEEHPIATNVPAQVYKLRRITGLNWEQLAAVMVVDRRTLHNWARGKHIASNNAVKLARVLATVEYIDRGTAAENRALLLQTQEDGCLLLDRLRAGLYEQVRALAGRGVGRASDRLKPLNAKGQSQVMPESFSTQIERLVAVKSARAQAAGSREAFKAKKKSARLKKAPRAK